MWFEFTSLKFPEGRNFKHFLHNDTKWMLWSDPFAVDGPQRPGFTDKLKLWGTVVLQSALGQRKDQRFPLERLYWNPGLYRHLAALIRASRWTETADFLKTLEPGCSSASVPHWQVFSVCSGRVSWPKWPALLFPVGRVILQRVYQHARWVNAHQQNVKANRHNRPNINISHFHSQFSVMRVTMYI